MSNLSNAQARLQLYLTAERKILQNQSYTIKDRTFTRADLAVVSRMISKLREEVAQIQNGGMKVYRIIPRG